MDYQLYGFLIGDEVRLDIESKRLFSLSPSWDERHFSFCAIHLNDTMMQLFVYLLNYARRQSVTKDELFKNIWEKNNLIPSSQRLWQVINRLNKQLALVGLPDDFVKNIKGSGYIVNYDKILPLYYKTSDVFLSPEIKIIHELTSDGANSAHKSTTYEHFFYK
ncbi:winged helix-turn-helix domain-containing protein [Serratia fonticola]|uniref:winged helix-turn-helix domain-containing protein n=1 Tax=Serratia fonticola TaxID=47917 RepID=UPI0021789273|nr:helix-turn-helix domain-containing protein [Serratia fonticola]CAI1646213.1 Transcriptional regulatory protein, C terminal [Serratia fonticola]CAI1708930.1 Transcriptional regulatory protein, C terminal [Serratia fonticola]